MSRSPRWLPKYAVLAASFAIVFGRMFRFDDVDRTVHGAVDRTGQPGARQHGPRRRARAPPRIDGMAYPATAIDCAKPPAGYTGEFSQIKAVDRLTVEFDLCAPDVSFLSKIAFATNGILDSDWLAAARRRTSRTSRRTNGTGPYMVKEWVSGDHITMVANPNYTGPDKPIAPTLIFKWGDTAAKRLQDLQAGTVDGMDNVAPDDFDTVTRTTRPCSSSSATRSASLYLGFNVDQAPWNNEDVRQAIAQGIDRKRILDLFNPPGSTVADYFTPCSVAGGCEGDPWYAYNKDAAIAALKAANFDFSKTYDLYFRPKVRQYFPNPPDTATEIQAQFKDLGINLKIHTEDNATYLDQLEQGPVLAVPPRLGR